MSYPLLVLFTAGGTLRVFAVLISAFSNELYSKEFSLTCKRICSFIFFCCTLFVLLVWNAAGNFLDEIFYYKYLHTPIREPIFIIGNARSGTTWLHRLVSAEKEKYTSFSTWEILFAVSISWKVLFHYLWVFDQCLTGARFSTSLVFLVESFFENKYHDFKLQEAEEDEWIMMYIGYSQLMTLVFPSAMAVLRSIIAWDAGKFTKLYVLSYYKWCIQKHIYFREHTGKQISLRFISKNPAYTLRIESLIQYFPGCQVICMVRDPVAAVPSLLSYASAIWHAVASPVTRYPYASGMIESCFLHYTLPLELMRRDPNRAERWCIVFYEDLVNQGTETMNELSEFLARSATGGNTMAIPVNSLPMQQRPRTNHKYSLRECVDQSTEEEYEVSDSKRHPFHSNAYEQDLVSRMRELYDQYRRMKALMTNPTAAKEEVAVSEGRIPRD